MVRRSLDALRDDVVAGMIADLMEKQRAPVQRALNGRLHQRSVGSGPAVLPNSLNLLRVRTMQ